MSIVKHVSSTPRRLFGLDFKLEISKLHDMVNFQIDHMKEQERK